MRNSYPTRPHRMQASQLRRVLALMKAHCMADNPWMVRGYDHLGLIAVTRTKCRGYYPFAASMVELAIKHRHKNRLLIAAILEQERSDA